MTQLTLNQNDDGEFVNKQISEDKQNHSKEYCLNYLRTAYDIWDMRCWNKYKDRDEITEWVESDPVWHKNCGHAGFCIKLLIKGYLVSTEEIIDAIIENKGIEYKDYSGEKFIKGFF